jgi:lysozyme
VADQLLGVDVSSFQTVTDWNAVAAAGVQRVYVKATEGVTYVDPVYFAYMNGARQAGLEVGAYHFWRPNDDPVKQANAFLRNAGWNPAWLIPMLDVEVRGVESNADAQLAIATWLNVVSSQVGKPCCLYTYPSWWRELGDPQNFKQHPLWIADYGVAQPDIPGGWPEWAGWQYMSTGKIAGIVEAVDLTHWKT